MKFGDVVYFIDNSGTIISDRIEDITHYSGGRHNLVYRDCFYKFVAEGGIDFGETDIGTIVFSSEEDAQRYRERTTFNSVSYINNSEYQQALMDTMPITNFWKRIN